MSRWFRFYDEVLDDDKVQLLSPELFKAWVNCLCIASKNQGKLPKAQTLAFKLRISIHDAESRLSDLIMAGLIDILSDGSYVPHNWSTRQYQSDSSAERMRRHREKIKPKQQTVTRDVTCSSRDAKSDAVDPDPETDTESNLLPSEQDAARSEGLEIGLIGVGVGVRAPVSLEARRKAAKRLSITDAGPLVEIFDAWPRSKAAKNPDAMFLSSAATLFANAPSDVKERCCPLVDPIKPRNVRPSSELVASLRGRHVR